MVNSLKAKGIVCNLNPGEISVRGIQCKGKVDSYPEPVHIYIPKNYNKSDSNSFNVFFHGFESSVNIFQVNKKDTNGMGDFGARLNASEKNNGILVVPESRGEGVTYQKYFQDGTGKNFELFKNQIEQLTDNKFSKITLAGHSGGYLPVTALLKYPSVGDKVNRAALFDGTYKTSYPIADWLNKNPENKLRLSWTTGGEVVEKTNGFIALVKNKNQLIQVPTDGSHIANIKDGGFADFLRDN